jgi:hypothetical protein
MDFTAVQYRSELAGPSGPVPRSVSSLLGSLVGGMIGGSSEGATLHRGPSCRNWALMR